MDKDKEIIPSSFVYENEEIRSIIVDGTEYFNIVQVAQFVKNSKDPNAKCIGIFTTTFRRYKE